MRQQIQGRYRQSFRLRLLPEASVCFTRRVVVEFVDNHRRSNLRVMLRKQVAALNRRKFLKASGAVSLSQLWPRSSFASPALRRVRPSDANWPSSAAWKRLNEAVGGNLIQVDFPMNACVSSSQSADCQALFASVKNPYYIGDNPGITQTLGWVDGWATKPSVYAVAARNADDIAAAVNFARENNLRLVVKGGGHSYQGTSNAPDSLLIWTRHMNDVEMHAAFVPHGCEGTHPPQRAATLGAGA